MRAVRQDALDAMLPRREKHALLISPRHLKTPALSRVLVDGALEDHSTRRIEDPHLSFAGHSHWRDVMRASTDFIDVEQAPAGFRVRITDDDLQRLNLRVWRWVPQTAGEQPDPDERKTETLTRRRPAQGSLHAPSLGRGHARAQSRGTQFD